MLRLPKASLRQPLRPELEEQALKARPDPVRGHGKTILHERDSPADQDHSGRSGNLRCPYQAKVIKTFEIARNNMGTNPCHVM